MIDVTAWEYSKMISLVTEESPCMEVKSSLGISPDILCLRTAVASLDKSKGRASLRNEKKQRHGRRRGNELCPSWTLTSIRLRLSMGVSLSGDASAFVRVGFQAGRKWSNFLLHLLWNSATGLSAWSESLPGTMLPICKTEMQCLFFLCASGYG